MTQHTTLGNQSMALFSLVSLNQEHLLICHALRLASELQIVVHGAILDSLLFTATRGQMRELQAAVARKLRPDGSAILQVKDKRKTPGMPFIERVVAKKVSHWRPFTPCKGPRRFSGEALRAWMHDPHFAHQREWKILSEPEGIGT